MTKTDQVIKLMREGLKTGEIYQRMRGQMSYGSISSAICKYRREHGISRLKQCQISIDLEPIDFDNFLSEAENRKTTPEALARKVLSAIINDDLFKAVLDQ